MAGPGRFKTRVCAAAHDVRLERLPAVNDSLSIILPVRDCQATLSEQVHHLLEVVPDLTSRFEIILVDDASIDHTPEVARELVRQYPQLRLICHSQSRGREAAVHTGLATAASETVFVAEALSPMSPTDMRRLWSLRHHRGATQSRLHSRPGIIDPELIDRLTTWGQALRNLARRSSSGKIQMIRRDEAQTLAGRNNLLSDSKPALRNFLPASISQDAPQRP
jgi:glycosyltransferase involved in cell wall biosynthesis